MRPGSRSDPLRRGVPPTCSSRAPRRAKGSCPRDRHGRWTCSANATCHVTGRSPSSIHSTRSCSPSRTATSRATADLARGHRRIREDVGVVAQYHFLSEYTFEGGPERIWTALNDVTSWPSWWSWLKRVDVLREPTVAGEPGAIYRNTVRAPA